MHMHCASASWCLNKVVTYRDLFESKIICHVSQHATIIKSSGIGFEVEKVKLP